MSYDVFIERAQDPAATAQVASAIADRYGMPEEAIARRMAAGRFRVKANVDLETAKKFAADLERLGAVCTVARASASAPVDSPSGRVGKAATVLQSPPAIPAGRARPAPGKPTVKATPGPPASARPPGPPVPHSRSSQEPDYQSGLSAAFATTPSQGQQLGALESGEFKLSALDGSEDLPASYAPPVAPAPQPPVDFEPPDDDDEELQLLDMTPTPPPPPGPSESFAPPVDAFAPPSEDSVIEIDDALMTSQNTPPPMPAAAPPQQRSPIDEADDEVMPLSAMSGSMPAAGGTAATSKLGAGALFREHFLDKPRVRIAAGVFVVVMLAWIPAWVYWGNKVDSAQAELNAAMQEPVSLAKSSETAWLELTEIGNAQKQLGESRLVNTKITAILMWLAIGGLLGFVYFKKIPWDEF